MKRLFISLLLLVPVMTFAGCGAGDDSSEIDIPEVPNDPETTMMITTIRERLPPETERF